MEPQEKGMLIEKVLMNARRILVVVTDLSSYSLLISSVIRASLPFSSFSFSS